MKLTNVFAAFKKLLACARQSHVQTIRLQEKLEVGVLSKRWVEECERLLYQMKEFSKTKGKDRLEVVRTMRFVLYSLQRSVSGWLEWIDNLDMMASFSFEELQEINRKLVEMTEDFVEYDVKITGKCAPVKQKTSERAERTERSNIFYVK
jgi:hypothetical protein